MRSSAAGSHAAPTLAGTWLDRQDDGGQFGAGSRRGLRPGSAALIVLLMGVAVGLAWAFREIGRQPVIYDADNYLTHARILAFESIQDWGTRTYGYPAFLVPWVVLFNRDPLLLQWCVFLAQIAIHLAASWYVARRVAAAFDNQSLGRLTFAIVLLNPFLLIMAGLLLSDFLSTALIAVAVGLLLPTRDTRPALVMREGMLALFTLTLAVEVRPANAILLPVGALLWAMRWWAVARADLRRFAGGLMLVGLVAALPFVPQSIINWRAHGDASPLVVNALYGQQVVWGVQNLKYATFALPEHPGASAIFYANPFSAGQSSLTGLAAVNPPGLVATLALHAFALFDQDFPFPYVTELEPWHRWPLAILGYLFVWAAGLGIAVGGKAWWRSGARFAWGTLLLTSAAYVLVYLPTAVECRFALPLYVLLAPVAAYALLRIGGWIGARAWRPVAVSAIAALLAIGASAWLSDWVQAQAPALVMTRDILRSPDAFLPVARLDSTPPERWTVEQRQKYVVQATNLGQHPWKTQAPGKTFLRIRWIGPGPAQTSDARVELRPALTQEVPPGGQLTLNVTVTAPRVPGEYRLRYQFELEEHPGRIVGQPFDTPVTVVSRRDGRR